MNYTNDTAGASLKQVEKGQQISAGGHRDDCDLLASLEADADHAERLEDPWRASRLRDRIAYLTVQPAQGGGA